MYTKGVRVVVQSEQSWFYWRVLKEGKKIASGLEPTRAQAEEIGREFALTVAEDQE